MAEDPVSVLIVDDQLPFLMAARAVVRATPGFEVVGEVQSGEEAVTQAGALCPQLVLMDINMGGMNGIAATRQILSNDPSVRVVLLSTYASDDLPADARTCGASAYVHKEQFGPAVLDRVWRGEPGDTFSR